MTMDHIAHQALFRQHATAMFRGERDESHRIERRLYPEHATAHHLFLQALFVTCVTEHFGAELDRRRLRRFIARLKKERPGVSPLKTEALVRVFYGETQLYAEIPHVDHWPCMWSAAQMIVGADRDDTALAELYDRAEATGRDMVDSALRTEDLFGPRRETAVR